MTEPSLNQAMKAYEHETVSFVNRKSYTVIRVDGKSFHSYTRGLKRPYDEGFMANMDATAVFLCDQIATARFAYVQSDEISVLLTDWNLNEDKNTQPWLDGKVQKMVSVSASLASTSLNFLAPAKTLSKLAAFDSRVFNLPDREAAELYFRWRYYDAQKNSVSMAAHNTFSPQQLDGRTTSDRVSMLLEAGVDWNMYPEGFKNGRLVTREKYDASTTFFNPRTGFNETVKAERHRWVVKPAVNLTSEIIELVPDK